MKRLNNRGFAISTILYGVVIMVLLIVTMLISIMSSVRNNNKKFTTQLDDELMALADSRKEFTSGNSWTTPIKGYYRIELYDKTNNKYQYGYMEINKNVTITYTAPNTISGISWSGSVETFKTTGLSENKLIIEYLSDKEVKKSTITSIPVTNRTKNLEYDPTATTANIATGNYYIVVGPTTGNLKSLQSVGDHLIVADFHPEQTWHIMYVQDFYSGTEDCVDGYRIINTQTGKTFESIALTPIAGSGIAVTNYTKLDTTKKWIIDYASAASPSNVYYIRNLADKNMWLKYTPSATNDPFVFDSRSATETNQQFTLYRRI